VTDVGPGDPRDALIGEQARLIAVLEARIAELEERLAAAERAASRDSGISSMPPSADDLPGRRQPRKQPRDSAGGGEPPPALLRAGLSRACVL
jgi:hypothetical protein